MKPSENKVVKIEKLFTEPSIKPEFKELSQALGSFFDFIAEDAKKERIDLPSVSACSIEARAASQKKFEELLAMNKKMQSLYQLAADLANEMMAKTTLLPRDIEQISILTRSIQHLQRYLQNKTLTDEERATLQKNVQTIRKYIQEDNLNPMQKQKWGTLWSTLGVLLGLASVVATICLPVLLVGLTTLAAAVVIAICIAAATTLFLSGVGLLLGGSMMERQAKQEISSNQSRDKFFTAAVGCVYSEEVQTSENSI